MYGMSSVEKTVEYIDGDQYYTINLNANKGTNKLDNRWSKLAAYKAKETIADIILQDDGGTKSGDTVLLDQKVSIWDYNSGTTLSKWTWKGLLLKEYKSLVGLKYEMTATTIIENTPFPEDLIPQGVIITR